MDCGSQQLECMQTHKTQQRTNAATICWNEDALQTAIIQIMQSI